MVRESREARDKIVTTFSPEKLGNKNTWEFASALRIIQYLHLVLYGVLYKIRAKRRPGWRAHQAVITVCEADGV